MLLDEEEHSSVWCCAIHKEELAADGGSGSLAADGGTGSLLTGRLKQMPSAVCDLVHKDSSLDKLLNNMAIRRRWVINILHRALPEHFNKICTGAISMKELEAAEKEAVRVAQQEYYGHAVLEKIQ